MYLPPEQRIRTNRDGKAVLLPNPARWPYTPEMIDAIGKQQNSSILISGPTGCGKEELAAVLTAKGKKFTAINCVGIDGPLIESELFGHVKGSFTGAVDTREGILSSAGNGTVFLDEIGRMPIASQARLLRYMQTGEIRPVGGDKPLPTNTRARIIAATNQHVHDTKLFLPDLLQRFDFHIELPRLADRGADALYLLALPDFAPKGGLTAMSLGTACSALLYEWPGNIRELMKFRRNAQFFQSLSEYVPFDSWPDQVLRRQPQHDGAAQLQMLGRLEKFCEFSIFALNKLISSNKFLENMKSDDKPDRYQRTAAILQSIPWILTNESFASLSDPSDRHPIHPQILPFSMFQSSSHDVKYDLTSIIYELTGDDVWNALDNPRYGPSISANLPQCLEILVQLYDEERSLPVGVDCMDFIEKFTFEPSVQDLLEKLHYSVKPSAEDDEFKIALLRARLDEKSEKVCRAVYSDKQAGKPKKDTEALLGMPPSTLRAKVASICRDHPDLKKFIGRPPGRPSQKAK